LITDIPKKLYLYSTSHCHLCETACELLAQIFDVNNLDVVEISDDAFLLAQYGLKIPVLQRQDTQAELNWPFTTIDIIEFLK
jgi:hypothetical protein